MVLGQEHIEALLQAIYEIEQNPIRIEPQGNGDVVVEVSAPITIRVNRSAGDITDYTGQFSLPAYDGETIVFRGSDLAPLKTRAVACIRARETHTASLNLSRDSLEEALRKLNEMSDELTLERFRSCVEKLYTASAGQVEYVVNVKDAYALGEKLLGCNSIVRQFGSDDDKRKFTNLESAIAVIQRTETDALYTGTLNTEVAAQAFFMAYQMKQRQAAQTQ